MEHVPAAIRLALLPMPAQVAGVVLVKVIGNPEDAVADSATEPAVNGALPGAVKEIVCGVPEPHGANEAPVTVVVLLPLTKSGAFPDAPIGAKLTVAVTAAAEADMELGFAMR